MDIVKTLKFIATSISKASQLTTFENITALLVNEGSLSESEVEEISLAHREATRGISWATKRLPELEKRMQRLDFLRNNARANFSGVLTLFATLIFLFNLFA